MTQDSTTTATAAADHKEIIATGSASQVEDTQKKTPCKYSIKERRLYVINRLQKHPISKMINRDKQIDEILQ